ncbi:MAG TPA: peptidase domain-containing ABC transporter [Terriglobia bacterium]|nr:peptidase domain-containing ABC transporter [Terriglobia bacterium]
MNSPLVDRFPALRRLQAKGTTRQIPFIQQLSATDCGAACLAMVLAYYGKHVSLGEIRDVSGVNRDGVDGLTLLKAGRWYGLQGRGARLNVDDLRYVEKGTILHWEFSHFVVFDKLRKDGVEIVDPACGRRFVGMEQFSQSFTGVAVIFKPSSHFEPTSEGTQPVWSYVKRLVRHSGLLWRIVLISLLLQLFALAVPALTGLLVSRVVPRSDIHLLHVVGFGLVGVVLFQFLSSLIRSKLLLYLRTQLDAQMTLGFVEHLSSLPYSFFQQRSNGDLMMRVGSNNTIREILTSSTVSGVLDGAMVTLYLLILLAANPPLAAVAVVLGLLQVGLFLLSYGRYQELMSQDLQAQSRTQSHLLQMLAGIETLKASGTENQAVQQWSDLYVDQVNVSLSRGRLNATVESLMSALHLGSPLLVLWFGAVQVVSGNLSLGTMLALTALASGFLGPISTLITSGLQLQLLRSYIVRIDDVLKTPREQDESRVRTAERLSGAIQLDKVTFRYGPLAPTGVGDVSVKITPGQMVAIVGQSGAGKSTLAKLMLGLYQPSSGRVLYDGVDIAGLNLSSVRHQIGVVTQRSYLFGTTVRGNIALNDSSVAMSKIVKAAERACIHEEITAMAMGYETMVIEGGGSLSGGQRQRVALARALVHEPAIVLLDEATSELDAITENQVHRNLADLRCTRIVIAHRLSTVRNADIILVLNEGTIVEQGSHEELLENNRYYAALVRSQLKAEEVDVRDKSEFRNSKAERYCFTSTTGAL